MTKFKEGDKVRYVLGGKDDVYEVRKQWKNHRTPMVTAKRLASGAIMYFSADELEKVEEE